MRGLLLLLLMAWALASSGSASAVPIISDVVDLSTASSDKAAAIRYRQGVEALSRGDIAIAEAAFRESLRLAPDWHGSLLGLADAATRDRRPQDASALLDQAQAMAPQSVEVWTARGRFHFITGEREQAEAAYSKAISLNPEALLPRVDIADLYLQDLWKPQEAAQAYRAVLAISPDHAAAHYGLGVALMAVGERQEAVTQLETATTLAPENPLPHFARGRLQASMQRYREAIASFDAALAAQPGFAIVHVYRGDALAALGDVDAAVADYQAALTAAPGLAVAHFKLGSIYQYQQRWEDAENAYLKAIESDPQNVRALNNLAWISAERANRLDDALAWARRAVALAPDEAAFQDTLGWVLRARGELADAAEVLSKAATVNADIAEIPYHLGIVYDEMGKTSEAIAALRKALEIDETFPGASDAKRRIGALSNG